MQATEIEKQIEAIGVVPVIAIERTEHALPLADSLIAGGMPLVEITFRTAAAEEVIRILAQERSQLMVGAGTVLSSKNVEMALKAGARFAVAPGLNRDVVKAANDLGLPFMPGVATPSEIELALSLGCRTLKFFPAELLGGVEMIRALIAPYAHTGVRFIPTGGVNPMNLESYLSCQGVVAVGGTWLARKEDMAEGKWQEIQKRSRVAMETVHRVRAVKAGDVGPA
jgi:2-dehydro-3-deoxyphosphogluconate aldolase/(4S)-4-hydroxy-2-oxoglutarate aldolase